MKKIILITLSLFITFLSKAQETNKNGLSKSGAENANKVEPTLIGGYRLENQEVVFVFTPAEVSDYNTSYGMWKKSSKVKINEVFVSGEFNDWQLNIPKFKMTQVGEVYEFRMPIDLTQSKTRYEFKFVVNGKYWAEPSSKYKNVCQSTDYPGPQNFYLELKK
ncbi:MAG: hypothetical protein CFE21_01395 [Bacteroidetes bacterium B1(2017)]|nr:MAG: hypothetical protein CFE21_01395 [Bacteroidetes bacterium B1(2017)]